MNEDFNSVAQQLRAIDETLKSILGGLDGKFNDMVSASVEANSIQKSSNGNAVSIAAQLTQEQRRSNAEISSQIRSECFNEIHSVRDSLQSAITDITASVNALITERFTDISAAVAPADGVVFNTISVKLDDRNKIASVQADISVSGTPENGVIATVTGHLPVCSCVISPNIMLDVSGNISIIDNTVPVNSVYISGMWITTN